MSHFSTIKLVNIMGENFDESMKEWKTSVKRKMKIMEVNCEQCS